MVNRWLRDDTDEGRWTRMELEGEPRTRRFRDDVINQKDNLEGLGVERRARRYTNKSIEWRRDDEMGMLEERGWMPNWKTWLWIMWTERKGKDTTQKKVVLTLVEDRWRKD